MAEDLDLVAVGAAADHCKKTALALEAAIRVSDAAAAKTDECRQQHDAALKAMYAALHVLAGDASKILL